MQFSLYIPANHSSYAVHQRRQCWAVYLCVGRNLCDTKSNALGWSGCMRLGSGLRALVSVMWRCTYSHAQVLEILLLPLRVLCILYFSLLSAALLQAPRYPPWGPQWPGKSSFHSWNICKLQLWDWLLPHWNGIHLLYRVWSLEPSFSCLSRCVFAAES